MKPTTAAEVAEMTSPPCLHLLLSLELSHQSRPEISVESLWYPGPQDLSDWTSDMPLIYTFIHNVGTVNLYKEVAIFESDI